MSRATYKAVLFAPDGEWVTDYRWCASVSVVEAALADQGSRWIFYPFHGVIRESGSALTSGRSRLVSVAWPFEHMRGRTVATFGRMLAAMTEAELEEIVRC